MSKANCFDCGHSIEVCVCVDNVGCQCCDKFIDNDCVLVGEICPKDK
jgi:hypothetical protein